MIVSTSFGVCVDLISMGRDDIREVDKWMKIQGTYHFVSLRVQHGKGMVVGKGLISFAGLYWFCRHLKSFVCWLHS